MKRTFLCVTLIAFAACCTKEMEEVKKPADNAPQTTAPVSKEAKRTNRLSAEKSPYLLQHAHNPVDWFPWGEEAFECAKKEDKPIFLSIGYSTCHWCHVMERESFENEEIASLLNKSFVCIKVDREERPDIDNTYMTVVQMMTHRGGWPLSAFLTPDLKPFYGGTYFPPDAFKELLQAIAEKWKSDRQKIGEIAGTLTDSLRDVMQRGESKVAKLGADTMAKAMESYAGRFDEEFGGFGGAPKFPPAMDTMFLMRMGRRTGEKQPIEIVEKTLVSMRGGGIYDHVGGGFHRYSTDGEWLVPHFEKMLYDNALLSMAYIEAYQTTKNPFYADVVRETLDYILRDMTASGGGFFAAEDADSEGVEGKFYVWDKKEMESLLTPEEAAVALPYFGVTQAGNFEGTNILHESVAIADAAKLSKIDRAAALALLRSSKSKLLAARSKRIRPLRDEKILTSWNGLTISAMARAYQVLGDDRYLQAARAAANVILKKLVDPKGRLLHRHIAGDSRFPASLDDYADFVAGLIDLYEASAEARWLGEALRLNREMIRLFHDEKDGGFWDVGSDVPVVLANSKETHDGVTPSGNAQTIVNLLRLSELTSDEELRKVAAKSFDALSATIAEYPSAHAMALCALDFSLDSPKEIVIVGNPRDPNTAEMIRAVHDGFLPNKILVVYDGSEKTKDASRYVKLLEGRLAVGERPIAYVCEGKSCRLPATSAEELRAQLFGGR